MLICKVLVVVPLVLSTTASSLVGRRDGTTKISSPFSVPIKLNTAGIGKDLVQKDLARIKAFRARYFSKSKDVNVARDDTVLPLANAGTSFKAQVDIGSPSKQYNLLIDTGSSNVVLSTRANYTQTSSSTNTTRKVHIKYGSGNFEGFEFTDTLTLGNVSITEQSISIATKDEGFEDLDGILGLGPDDLTKDTVDGMDIVPTVTDNLESQGQISTAVVGLSFPPSTEPQTKDGSLAFGTPDASQFTGDVAYVPITKTSPASTFWGIDQSISYGDGDTILNSTAGIVDTGTTLLLLATDAFNAYSRVTGATLDKKTSLLKIDNADTLQSLFLHIGDHTYEFTANAQIWPRIHNTAIGGDKDATYLVVSDNKTPSGQGMDFILGLTFLQRFYSIYDTPNARVGFATTPDTFATSN